MNNWKFVIGGLVIVFAYLIVSGSALVDSPANFGGKDSIAFAALTFLSVIVTHWLLWRFIIPLPSSVPAETTSFFAPRSQGGFIHGTINSGYMIILSYCVNLSGALHLHQQASMLGLGLFLIVLGTAARLRAVFAPLGVFRVPPNQLPDQVLQRTAS